MSPSFNTHDVTWLPLTNVPLELPRSRIVKAPPSTKHSMCCFDTLEPATTMSQDGCRPMMVLPSRRG